MMLLLAGLLVVAGVVGGQPAGTPPPPAAALGPDTPVAPEDFASDLALLRRVMVELHPGLLRYNTAEEADRLFRPSGPPPTTLRGAFLELSRITAAVRCGHTQVNFYNQRKAVAAGLLDGPRCLPFAFLWIDGSMVVTGSADPRVARGARITAVDGVPAADILRGLMPYARADGGNDAKRVDQLSVSGQERWAAFDVFFSHAFPTAAATRTLTLADGTTVTVTLTTREARAAALPPEPAAGPAGGAAGGAEGGAEGGAAEVFATFPVAGWTAMRAGPGVVVLRMDTWALYRETWDWRAGLESFADRLIDEKVDELVLDLRRNEGGNDCGDVLLARMIGAPVALPRQGRFVRAARVPADLNPVLDTWDDSFRDWGRAATPAAVVPAVLGRGAGEVFVLRRDADDDPGATVRPAGRRFAGRLWVLVSATNSSATFQFAQVVQRAKLGTLVGSPTGGNQRGINGGCFFFVRLPKTGLEVDLPLIATAPTEGSAPDAGLTPDIVVETTADDIAAGRDPEMRAVLGAIGRPR